MSLRQALLKFLPWGAANPVGNPLRTGERPALGALAHARGEPARSGKRWKQGPLREPGPILGTSDFAQLNIEPRLFARCLFLAGIVVRNAFNTDRKSTRLNS